MNDEQEEPAPNEIAAHNNKGSRRKETLLHDLAARQSNKRDVAALARRDPKKTLEDLYESLALTCIQHHVEKKTKESKDLQDFFRNGFLTPAILKSNDYKPEYLHHFGIQAYGIPESALAGALTFGTLNALQVGSPWIQGTACLVSAVVTSNRLVFGEQRTRDRFAMTPIVAGRSVLSEELCPIVCTTFHKLLGRGYQAKNPDLAMFGSFATNCETRQSFEAKIRVENGLAKDVPISIPPPGVPKHFSTVRGDHEGRGMKPLELEDVAPLVVDQEQFLKHARPLLEQNWTRRKKSKSRTLNPRAS